MRHAHSHTDAQPVANHKHIHGNGHCFYCNDDAHFLAYRYPDRDADKDAKPDADAASIVDGYCYCDDVEDNGKHTHPAAHHPAG